MTATVRAGERGVDFSFARPPAARLLELGYTFVVGYISVYPASPAKNITKDECDTYIAAGLRVLLVWEMSASRASLGEAYGKTDGVNARQLAKARGYPIDVPILVADDTNTIPANIDVQEAYMRGFASACWPYPIGIYGDTDILNRCAGLWQIGWMPNAWSWSGTSRAYAEAKARALGAHVLQHTGFYIDNTWAVDPNEAIADFPAWGLEQPDPPTPTPSEDPLNYYVVTGANAKFIGLPPNVSWTGPGNAKVDAAIATQLTAGNLVQVNLTGGPNAFGSTFLTGPLPTGDALHTWTGDEFAAVLPAAAGATVDQVARDAAAVANVGVATLASRTNAAGDALKAT